MCGIVGITGSGEDAVAVLLDGLRRLEYRGYDSAGIAVSTGTGILCEKCPGKIEALERKLRGDGPLGSARCRTLGMAGLGHTRWATHGPPTGANAHPHFSCDRRIALVHNGIIENSSDLRAKLIREGHTFRSQTDTEVMAHLIEKYYREDPLRALTNALKRIVGSFALGVLFADHPWRIYAARLNSPLVIGLAEGCTLLASDIPAVLPYTRRLIILGEKEVAELAPESVGIWDLDLKKRRQKTISVDWTIEVAEKGGYPHFMLKEIHEQPRTAAADLAGRIKGNEVKFDGLSPNFLRKFRRVTIAACGTAWHAGLVAKTALEEMVRIPVDIGMASELRYGDPPYDRSTLLLAISQSGETADTLAAVRAASDAGAATLAVTNVQGSTLSREADRVIHMRAGVEIGVAATKTYTSQLVNVLLLAIAWGRARGTLSAARAGRLLREARTLPEKLKKILANTEKIRKCAEKFMGDYDYMYIGRRYNLATAFEGALKMKEISYRHAEGYGGGEMKHGPLALVDRRLTTVAVAVRGRVYDKMISNIEEIRARGGHVVTVAFEGDRRIMSVSDHVLRVPRSEEMFSPVTAVVPLQLLAYYTAAAADLDVDHPRNLAKSVTVE